MPSIGASIIYCYNCNACGHSFDVIKRYTEMEREERCEACKEVATRQFVPQRIHLLHTAVQSAEYNPGLGVIVKDRQHRAEICKQKGLEEIGNEKPEALHNHFDKAREEKREREWEKADKGWVGNGE